MRRRPIDSLRSHSASTLIFLKENLFGVELLKVIQLINKPFQLCCSYLEWSKLHMYCAYATLKDWYRQTIRLLYTDTDSLIIHVKNLDLYKDILDVPILR